MSRLLTFDLCLGANIASGAPHEQPEAPPQTGNPAMNIAERAKMLQASSQRVSSLITSINDIALNLTGGLGVSGLMESKADMACAEGTIGYAMELAHCKAIDNEERLEVLLRFLEETLVGSSKVVVKESFKEPETRETADIPRFLKRDRTDDQLVNTVARELGVERI